MRQCPDPELSRAHACLSLYLAVHLSWVSTHSSPESKVYVSVRVYMSAERRQVYMQTWGPFMFCSSGWSSASHQVAFISTLAISIWHCSSPRRAALGQDCDALQADPSELSCLLLRFLASPARQQPRRRLPSKHFVRKFVDSSKLERGGSGLPVISVGVVCPFGV